ncbi:MAG: PAS domain S-box protein [Bryobacteraceae bacterium]
MKIERTLSLSSSLLQGQVDLEDPEATLLGIAEVFLQTSSSPGSSALPKGNDLPNADAKYRTLIEQLPAVVFMVSFDRGSGEAYVSPHIEELLGFSQEEWLEDPIRWYERIHPDDKLRWNTEAAEMFLTAKPLRSVYRVMARNGRVISFHCEAKMVRGQGGQPSFIHGVAFDVTELKQAEDALHEERNFAAALLDTLGALVVVLDCDGRIVRFNRACERATGYTFSDVQGQRLEQLLADRDESARFESLLYRLAAGELIDSFESSLATREGAERRISWSGTVLIGRSGSVEYVIITGIDVTESKRLERAILDISSREQRRIGEDLHDGLGQHLTGIAFMSKVLEQKLAEKSLAESAAAAKIVKLVNEAIRKTRDLSRGLVPVMSDALGLMSALEQLTGEVYDLFQIGCRFECLDPVLIHDNGMGMHLYHIAQEAVNNAVKHGKASAILIRLRDDGAHVTLTIEDDGIGIPQPAPSTGMGLNIMSHRARMIGGELSIERRPHGGTLVTCVFQPR